MYGSVFVLVEFDTLTLISLPVVFGLNYIPCGLCPCRSLSFSIKWSQGSPERTSVGRVTYQ